MHPIVKLIAQRLALGLLLLFAASILIFAGTVPGWMIKLIGSSVAPVVARIAAVG